MKTNKKWHGCDVSNKISLFEYGLLFRETNDGLQVIYQTGEPDTEYERYHYDYFEAEDFLHCEWADMDMLDNGSRRTGERYRQNPEQFCSDLVAYHGTLNVFGFDYSAGCTASEIKKRLNRAL